MLTNTAHKTKMKLSTILLASAVAMAIPSQSASAMAILLSNNGSSGTDVVSRLTGLGHTVTVSNAATWGDAFNYVPYDVVAFEFGSANPANIARFVNAVAAGDVGAVFLRGYGAEATATALGLISGGTLNWQSPGNLNLVNNSHYITSGESLGVHNVGYTYMSATNAPGMGTTTLATGPSGAALVVSNTTRAVLTPFYGHSSNYASETPFGVQITQRSLEWAAGANLNTGAVPEPASLALFGVALAGAVLARRRRAGPHRGR